MLKPSTQDLVSKMLKGDASSLARLISLIEMESPETPGILEQVASIPRQSFKIGITGLAGAGKSTLIDKLITRYRQKGLAVGVIAIDPTSWATGGAVLGDRIRMPQHFLDNGVFIRSMATRGHYGGLSQAVDNTIRLMQAFGKDIIFIETTGVGQSEADIVRVADLVFVLLIPGFGDSIQLMKAGLIEIADIIVINKVDRESGDSLAAEIHDELSCSTHKIEPSVFLAEAVNDVKISDIFQEIEKRRQIFQSAQISK